MPTHAPFVALLALLKRRFPDLDDPARLIMEGAVVVDGLPAASNRTRVRADAAIQIRGPRPLRGTIKLAGFGQLGGWLRADPRVINLERTNVADLGPHLIGEPIDLVTVDLSYLSVAGAVCQLDRRMMAPDAQLIGLVKPTFELRTATLAATPEQVAESVDAATDALEKHGWRVLGQLPSPIRGAKGAIEVLVHAANMSTLRS